MGNVCGCNDSSSHVATSGSIKSAVTGSTQYKNAAHQSKINSAAFSGLTPQEKDIVLAEAFKILVSTVETSKISSSNPYIKQFTTKSVGKIQMNDNNVYEGEMIDGVANGVGKIKSKDGSEFEGRFFNGVEHGAGKFTKVEPGFKSEFSGEYERGNPLYSGVHKIVGAPDASGLLEGGFLDGESHGPHIMKYQDGTSAYFVFNKAKMEGTDVWVSKDLESLIVTEFKDGKEVSPGIPFVAQSKLQAAKK